MPTYEYRCSSCGHTMEVFQKITAEPLILCPNCHKNDLKRGPGGGIGLSFKGSGFYINDYKSTSGNPEKKEMPPKKDKCEPQNKGCCPCSKPK